MGLQLNQCGNRLYDKQTEADPNKSRRIGKMLATPVVRHQSRELFNQTGPEYLGGLTLEWKAVISDSANRERVSQQHLVRFLSITSLEFRFRGYNLANFRRLRFPRIILASSASDAQKRCSGWGVRSLRDASAEDIWGAACVLELVGQVQLSSRYYLHFHSPAVGALETIGKRPRSQKTARPSFL